MSDVATAAAPPPPPAGTSTSPTTTWTLPRMPDEDVDAVRALARAYQQLASELGGAGQAAQVALGLLPGAWRGEAATASSHPTGVLVADVDLVCRGLSEAADALSRCATELQKAHDRYGWSWGKALKVGAVVVVSAAAVTLTVGAAAPGVAAADAALVGGEVATAELAVASATAARTGATVAFASSARLLAAVRGLGALLRPQLPWATGLTGVEATWQVQKTGTLDPKQLAVNFGLGLMVPAAMARSRATVRALPMVRDRRVVASVGSHLAAGGTVSALDAGRQQVLTGRVDTGKVVRAGVTGAGMSAAGDLVQRLPHNWRPGAAPGIAPGEAAVPRQTLDDAIRSGVNLPAHEGPKLGHAIDRHVGKSFSFLQQRLDGGGRLKSSFTDLPTAERAVTETLRANRDEVLRFMAGRNRFTDPISLRFDGALGKVLASDGTRTLGRKCIVALGKDEHGAYVKSAWLEP